MSAINNIVKNNVTYQVQDARVDSMTGVYEATYNETTFADVVAKYNAGWTIICNKGSHELHMVDYSAGTFSFAATLGSSDLSTLQYEVAKLSAAGWSANNENVQNKLVAGSNIAISGNVISATGGASYTAGNGINIANNVVSAKYANGDITVDANGNLKTAYGGSVPGSQNEFNYDKRSLDITPVASTNPDFDPNEYIQYDVSSAFTSTEVINLYTAQFVDGKQSPSPQLILKLTTNDGDYDLRASGETENGRKRLHANNDGNPFEQIYKTRFWASANDDKREIFLDLWYVDSTVTAILYINNNPARENMWHLNRINLWYPEMRKPIEKANIPYELYTAMFDQIWNNIYGLSDRFFSNIWEKPDGTYVLKCTKADGEMQYQWVAES